MKRNRPRPTWHPLAGKYVTPFPFGDVARLTPGSVPVLVVPRGRWDDLHHEVYRCEGVVIEVAANVWPPRAYKRPVPVEK